MINREPTRLRHLRLPVTMHTRLVQMAQARGVSVSALIRIAIAETFFLGTDGANTHMDAAHPEGA